MQTQVTAGPLLNPTFSKPAPKPRLVSLDVFRGLTVAAMILVNNPGTWDHVYWPLDHAEWNGCTPTDLVMPFFLFIVGVSIVYAMDTKKLNPHEHRGLIIRISRRTGTLVLLGWILALFPSSPDALQQTIHAPLQRLATFRFMGVLQRIAIVYFICALIFLKTGWRTWLSTCSAIMLLYWIALTAIPVPDSHGGWLKPNLMPDTNLGAWIDRTLFTSAHLYRHAAWDPEGLLSSLSAVSSGLIGLLVGHYLKRGRAELPMKIAWLFTVGFVLILAGWTWSLALPFNKQLWTGSFALYTGGWAAMSLAAGYWVIDINGFRRGTSLFVAFGVNAITAFWASGLLVRMLMLWQLPFHGSRIGVKDYLYRTLIEPRFTSPELASLVAALIFVAVWSAIVSGMYWMKWIIKV
jgi:predicted acyltransferase